MSSRPVASALLTQQAGTVALRRDHLRSDRRHTCPSPLCSFVRATECARSAKPIFVIQSRSARRRQEQWRHVRRRCQLRPLRRAFEAMLSDFSAPICLAACQKKYRDVVFRPRQSLPRSGQTQRLARRWTCSRAHRQSLRRRSRGNALEFTGKGVDMAFCLNESPVFATWLERTRLLLGREGLGSACPAAFATAARPRSLLAPMQAIFIVQDITSQPRSSRHQPPSKPSSGCAPA